MKASKLFLILSFVLIIAGCGKNETANEPAQSQKQAAETPEGTLSAFNLEGYGDKGEKKWRVEGRSADILNEIVKLKNVVATAYGDEGNVTIVGDRGTFNKSNNDMHIEGNVRADTTDGAKLTADYLDWEAKGERVTTESAVKVEKENMQVTGNGAVAFPNLKHVTLKENVQVDIKPKETDKVKTTTIITCTGPLQVEYDKNLAVFNKDVVVEDERGKIYADKMDVYLEAKTRTITKVIATGNVKIVKEGNTTYSERAEYTKADGRVVLTGRPKLVFYSESSK